MPNTKLGCTQIFEFEVSYIAQLLYDSYLFIVFTNYSKAKHPSNGAIYALQECITATLHLLLWENEPNTHKLMAYM